MTNRLATSSSAYLRSAAHQPIDWYEFGEEAFALAKSLDKPVLLDIGAVWCHWCHVIDRESYENAEIAELINTHFVAVKVDRDQRPDIDARYQSVIQSLTGHGGWPLTGFLTHDGRVIYGGTYFPPQSMKQLLVKIHTVYQERKGELMEQADLLTAELAERSRQKENAPPSMPLTPALLDHVVQSVKRAYDPEWGGMGRQPKFPHHSALQYLITYANDRKEQYALDVLTKTLTEMALGGMYDQVAGGFHRYSVDREWHVPHFEKMAYDNAEALTVYSQAYRLTGNPLFKEIAEGIVDWVLRDLSDAELGGFYASQDADIDLEDDGDHFTWTLGEVRDALAPQQAEWVIHYYGLTADGDMHERPGRNVLRLRESLSHWAAHFNVSVETFSAGLAEAKATLLAVRTKRSIPFIDTTVYVNWNGMMVSGFLEAAEWLGLERARTFALKTLGRLNTEFWNPEKGVSHTTGIEGFLEDYAWLIQANLKAYAVTGSAEYLSQAEILCEQTCQWFADEAQGGFFDTSSQTVPVGLLLIRRKPAEDSPSSSANGVMVQNLLNLSLLTDKASYQALAEAALNYFVPLNLTYGFYVSAVMLGLYRYLNPPLKLELVGEEALAEEGLSQEALAHFSPGRLIKRLPISETSPVAEVRLCLGTRCLAPARSVETLESALLSLPQPVLL